MELALGDLELENERFEADQLRQRFDSIGLRHFVLLELELRHFDLPELDREGPRRFDSVGALHYDYVVLAGENPRRFDSAESIDLVVEVDCSYFGIFLFCIDF